MNTHVARFGIRANLGQFVLLMAINAFVGAMVGMERALLPLLAEEQFGVVSRVAVLSFVLTFGLAKALTNLVAGRGADALGRRRMLLAGWLVGLPVPFLVMFAPSWNWVVAANVLLGVNQGLCWSAAVVMKVDLAGPARRGLAIGLNESTGYLAVAAAGFGSAWLAGRFGLRPWPFAIGVVAALAGLALSWFAVETRSLARSEAAARDATPAALPADRARHARSLAAVHQAGLVNNLNDGVSWGLLPLHFAGLGASLGQIGALVGLYPAVWAIAQLATGPLSDRLGRRPLITWGMALQAAALAWVALARDLAPLAWAMVALGLGTAMVYPALLSAAADHAHPAERGSVLGVYRFWRDMGYVAGAILAGLCADRFGIPAAILVVAALTLMSGLATRLGYVEARGDVR